jgi:hypothetical protein
MIRGEIFGIKKEIRSSNPIWIPNDPKWKLEYLYTRTSHSTNLLKMWKSNWKIDGAWSSFINEHVKLSRHYYEIFDHGLFGDFISELVERIALIKLISKG